MKHSVDLRRINALNSHKASIGPVIYWMSRDQRVHDNWGLLYAQELAEKNGQELVVVFCLVPHFLEATARQYGFMFKGLMEVDRELNKHNISFHLLLGNPSSEIVKFARKIKAGAITTDFDPLRIKKEWRESVAHNADCAVFEVDSHNIVPCGKASPKLEYGAYTIRPKIKKLLGEYLTDFPPLEKQRRELLNLTITDWQKAYAYLHIDQKVSEVDWCVPGERAAKQVLQIFIKERLSYYENKRNNPNVDGQSNLSQYLHFGQIAAQRIVLEITKVGDNNGSAKAYLEELIVRRELSDNYCFYNPYYDSVEGFPNWAKKTHNEHVSDRRDHVYSLEDFEYARTHDKLWNSAQLQMLKTGKMHGYMRMYWAKKIFEWTNNASEAFRIAIYLNDKYELDGRDPNGYVGVAWSIGGVHDRAWFERPVFGKIRYMSYSGCRSKFNVDEYIEKYS